MFGRLSGAADAAAPAPLWRTWVGVARRMSLVAVARPRQRRSAAHPCLGQPLAEQRFHLGGVLLRKAAAPGTAAGDSRSRRVSWPRLEMRVRDLD